MNQLKLSRLVHYFFSRNIRENGKPRKDIIREYDLIPSSLDKWVNQSKTSCSFKEKENLSPEQKELRDLRKRTKQLEMENDI
ncbi:transposase [Bacillus sp. WMMC1349]|nr:transposase [Bacillus sp. WMMC1349]